MIEKLLEGTFLGLHAGAWIALAVLVFIGGLYLTGFRRQSCPECGATGGLRATGATRNETGSLFTTETKTWEEEVRCRHCGHEEWQKREASSSGESDR